MNHSRRLILFGIVLQGLFCGLCRAQDSVASFRDGPTAASPDDFGETPPNAEIEDAAPRDRRILPAQADDIQSFGVSPERVFSPAQTAEIQRMVREWSVTQTADEVQVPPSPGDARGAAQGPEMPGSSNPAPASDLSPTMTAGWKNGMYFQSENKDFILHLGGRMQFDSVWWGQPKALQGPAPGNGGLPASGPGAGVGVLDDGAFFRRVRLRADGTAYGNVEFMLEIDFEQLNLITYDHIWVGMKDVPFLGTVRVGQHKVPQGLEMIGSDYHLTFMERSSLSDAFWTLFAPGIFIANNYVDQNVSFQTMFHRIQPLGFFTSDFGDGDYASTTRLTATPVYANEGNQVLHIGGSYQWRRADLGRTLVPGGTGSAAADQEQVVRFRARPELRDSIGITFPFDNAARFIDSGFLVADDVQTISPEFLWINGPLSVQAEGAFSFVENARSVFPTFGVAHGSPMFWGGYVQSSYFLTGEHRGYDRRFGTFDRPKVAQKFSLTNKDGDCNHCGCGAWEVGYRYSYVDLNDNGIRGGLLGQHTLGLNWYMNDNLKAQFNYLNIHREVDAPAVSGVVHGFGTLVQWYF